jgi:hypothetical protein
LRDGDRAVEGVMFWSPLSAAPWRAQDPVSEKRDGATEALARAAAGELLTSVDLASIFGLGSSRFHQLAKSGAFDLFKANPPIGLRCYSGVLVHRYVSGEPVYEPTFGRKRRRA